uniref:Calponin-homology (CH) domain-containing protein n=1 Tax=Periophthalmus magnuspinnatus TaxID=409849 RepID=A0A3B4ALG0_9GOBI
KTQLRPKSCSRLKVVLPEDLGSSLMDGVVLCHLANHIRPRSVASIHVPSPAVPKLSMAKCRRNVENFLDACRRIGVPEVRPGPGLRGRGTFFFFFFFLHALYYLSGKFETPPPSWHFWDLIGPSLVHVLCILLLFLAYTWTELT